MHIRIKSNEVVRYLSMGWKISTITFNETECYMMMKGSIVERILKDLDMKRPDINGKVNIPGTKITKRMLFCWYAIERYGLKSSRIAPLIDIDPTTVTNAHKRIVQLAKIAPDLVPLDKMSIGD